MSLRCQSSERPKGIEESLFSIIVIVYVVIVVGPWKAGNLCPLRKSCPICGGSDSSGSVVAGGRAGRCYPPLLWILWAWSRDVRLWDERLSSASFGGGIARSSARRSYPQTALVIHRKRRVIHRSGAVDGAFGLTDPYIWGMRGRSGQVWVVWILTGEVWKTGVRFTCRCRRVAAVP
jgi:hypothetical protein